MFEHIAKCNCGAITITINGIGYSMSEETFIEKYGNEGNDFLQNEMQNFSNCNYCVNHWGIDLCACGSGELIKECKEGLDVCNTPMQDIEQGQVNINGGW